MIPFCGIDRQYKEHHVEILEVTHEVLSTGRVLDGDKTRTFEINLARRCSRIHAIAVNSCTQALIFAQMALKGMYGSMHSDTKVLIPTQSFIATINSVVMANNKVWYTDVDENALMDIDKIDSDLNGLDVGIVMPVNLFGNMPDYDKLSLMCDFFSPNKPVRIIEDAAQSFGATYKKRPSGSLGDISVLSFDPTKNLPNYGSGGMLLTDDPSLAELCREFRDNGKDGGHVNVGTNSKMSEVDCAQMLVKLKYFDEWQKKRAEIANFYTECLTPYVDVIGPSSDVKSAWSRFVLSATGDRNALMSYLMAQEIETKIHYPVPLTQQDVAFASNELFPMADRHSKSTLSLPIYPELTDSEVEHIATSVVEYYTGT